MNETLSTWIQRVFPGVAPRIETLPASGSARINHVLHLEGGEKQILTENNSREENESFFYFSELFQSLDIPSPKILHITPDRLNYIQIFVGEKNLSEIISEKGNESPEVDFLIKKSLQQLYNLQQKTFGRVDWGQTFEYRTYDEIPVLHDLYYFKNFICDVLDLSYRKGFLLKEFYTLSRRIGGLGPRVLMIRDFNSRNILVKENEVFFIDYQSAMEGPALYDVVSLLYQAKANFSEDFRQKHLENYINLWPENKRSELWESLPYLTLIRFTQVLGAYGLRGLIQRKPHFQASLLQGIQNLAHFFHSWEKVDEFPHFQDLVLKLKENNTKQKIKKILL